MYANAFWKRYKRKAEYDILVKWLSKMNSKAFITIHDDEKYFGHWSKNSSLTYAMRIVPALLIRSTRR